MSFIVQRFERGDIEAAHEALNGVEYYVIEAGNWLKALSQESKSKLTGLGAKLKEIKKKVNQWREILKDVWGNRGKLEQVINELAEQGDSLSGFLGQIEGLRNEVAEKIQQALKNNQEAEWEKLVKEGKRLYNLKGKIEELKLSLGVVKSKFEVIKEVIRAKKGR
jgi:uncharacterized protein YoxC